MDEQPVALAIIKCEPNNCVSSLIYGVSPHPAHAPENSNSGVFACESGMVSASPTAVSGSDTAKFQFSCSCAISAAGRITSAFSFAGHTRAQFSHPVQSSGDTCTRKFRPENALPFARTV